MTEDHAAPTGSPRRPLVGAPDVGPSDLAASLDSRGPAACKETDDYPPPSPDVRGSSLFDDVSAFLAPPVRPDSLGRIGHHDVVELVGRGAFGVVLKAFDARLRRPVAIKVLAPHLWHEERARRRFLREARCAAAVDDEHVVRVHAVGGDDERFPYLVMEYVAGRTLQQRIDRDGALPPAEALRIAERIARGLAAAHAAGLIHRDVKPANVLLDEASGRAKLGDFGLARGEDDLSFTASSISLVGTPMYMSPEQVAGKPVDHRSDLFSLGSVLIAMCAGRAPYHGDSGLSALRRISEACPRPVEELRPRLPRAMADLLARLHALDPADRFASAAETAEKLKELRAALAAEPSGVASLADETVLGAPTAARGIWNWWAAAAARWRKPKY